MPLSPSEAEQIVKDLRNIARRSNITGSCAATLMKAADLLEHNQCPATSFSPAEIREAAENLYEMRDTAGQYFHPSPVIHGVLKLRDAARQLEQVNAQLASMSTRLERLETLPPTKTPDRVGVLMDKLRHVDDPTAKALLLEFERTDGHIERLCIMAEPYTRTS